MGVSPIAYFIHTFEFREVEAILKSINQEDKFGYIKKRASLAEKKEIKEFRFTTSGIPEETFEKNNFLIIDLYTLGSLNFTKNLMTFNSFSRWDGFLDYKNHRVAIRNICYELSKNLNLGPAIYMSECYDYTERYKGDSLEDFLGFLKTSFGEPGKIEELITEGSFFDRGIRADDPLYFVDDFTIGIETLSGE